MKILISGSHGFIGTHLREAYEKCGNKVIAIPRYLLHQPELLETFFIEQKPDIIIHLAAYGNMYDQKDKRAMVAGNIHTLLTMLEASRDTPYKAFINMSSSSVLLQTETMYSATKKAGEAICKAFSQEYHKSIISVRPSTVIGNGEQAAHLIPQLIVSAKTQQPIPFVSKPTHDYIDVRDLCSAIEFIGDNVYHCGQYAYNVSNNQATTNLEVAKSVSKALGKKPVIAEEDQLRPYDTANWKVDNTELLKLGWKPQYTLEETIEWMVEDEK